MKYSRNARIFKGSFDAAPVAGVLFLLVLFLLLHSALVFTPGVKIRLPAAEGLSGTSQPTVAVAVDRAGQLYYENQAINEAGLRARLGEAVKDSGDGLTLVIQADEGVGYRTIVGLCQLARQVGIREALLGTRPKVFSETSPKPLAP